MKIVDGKMVPDVPTETEPKEVETKLSKFKIPTVSNEQDEVANALDNEANSEKTVDALDANRIVEKVVKNVDQILRDSGIGGPIRSKIRDRIRQICH